MEQLWLKQLIDSHHAEVLRNIEDISDRVGGVENKLDATNEALITVTRDVKWMRSIAAGVAAGVGASVSLVISWVKGS